MTLSDVVIHVNECLDDSARYDLEEKMRGVDGVIAPRFNGPTPHLMIVAYDADSVHAHDLLDCVMQHGCTGQLVGGFSI